ncbi:MAG: GAF domain-containing protein [Gammaproteobacteria bacterium]
MSNLHLNTTLFEQLLKDGKENLDLQVGIVSKVDGDNYKLIAIDDVANEFKPGEVLHVNKTYCRDVIAERKTIALTEIDGIRGLQQHPLYAVNTLEAYIGAPIILNENVWGTINFTSMVVRPAKFSSSDIKLVNSYAGLIAESLAKNN